MKPQARPTRNEGAETNIVTFRSWQSKGFFHHSVKLDQGWSRRERSRMTLITTDERVALAGLLILIVALRAIRADQPIVENYVGRQIPTAMVARNLERGSGFLRPQLDTAPFPNLFLVEPPIFAAAVVGLRRATGLAAGAGRAGWSRRWRWSWGRGGFSGWPVGARGAGVALLALAAFAVFPITLRYGRAFQPDALMLGTLLAGLRCWDEHQAGGGVPWLIARRGLARDGPGAQDRGGLRPGPLISAIVRPPRARADRAGTGAGRARAALVRSTRRPGSRRRVGSRASADNGTIWLRVLIPTALFRVETLRVRRVVPDRPRVHAARPRAGGLVDCSAGRAAIDSGGSGGGRRWPRWRSWPASCTTSITGWRSRRSRPWGSAGHCAALAGRNWAASVAAGGCGLALGARARPGPPGGRPRSGPQLPEAARAVRAHVPESAWVVAPEALLFAVGPAGLPAGVHPGRRAARGRRVGRGPRRRRTRSALVEFYRARGARFVADVTADAEPRRVWPCTKRSDAATTSWWTGPASCSPT